MLHRFFRTACVVSALVLVAAACSGSSGNDTAKGVLTDTSVPHATKKITLAFSAMEEVGPGGHFFGAQHTQSRFRTAFHKPMLSDWRNYETWEEAGSPELPIPERPARRDVMRAYVGLGCAEMLLGP